MTPSDDAVLFAVSIFPEIGGGVTPKESPFFSLRLLENHFAYRGKVNKRLLLNPMSTPISIFLKPFESFSSGDVSRVLVLPRDVFSFTEVDEALEELIVCKELVELILEVSVLCRLDLLASELEAMAELELEVVEEVVEKVVVEVEAVVEEVVKLEEVVEVELELEVVGHSKLTICSLVGSPNLCQATRRFSETAISSIPLPGNPPMGLISVTLKGSVRLSTRIKLEVSARKKANFPTTAIGIRVPYPAPISKVLL